MSAANSKTWSIAIVGLGALIATGCHCVNRERCAEERCIRECPTRECVIESRTVPPTACVQPYGQPHFAPSPPNHVSESRSRPTMPNAGYRNHGSILHRVRYGLRKLNRSEEQTSVARARPVIAPPTPPANSASDHHSIMTRPARLGSADDPNAIEPWPFTAEGRPVPRPRQPRVLGNDDDRSVKSGEAWRYQTARHAPVEARSNSYDPPGRQTITPRPTTGHSAGPRFGSAPQTTDSNGHAARPLWQSTSYEPPPFRPGHADPVIRNFR